ncbi:MAG: lipid-binding SYLF domain-containing protein [Woeseiaceae bacterium]|jgi:lipid-binding SYLF domain-containing protein|nr:lipid-binding SYLF domain-containing protein [Woeseiaceae bacterium]MDG1016437.1 lipid-binding SYLF domain-containing protein [Woeseiaceae bacterium]MDG1712995.1 lipid-binding SYLF domain-containing protein [Woeseiaceae bacterium]MDG1864673.1 lipid-binding SYLF domain-containing protein [Woeseiaceae bacterium]
MKLIIRFIVLLLLLNTSVQAQSLNNKINNAVQSVQDSIRDVVEASASEIDKDANTALAMLREEISDSSLIIDQAYGYLVFPRIVKVGVGIGIETGEGVLRINDLSVDYYRLSSGSLGFQLGAQAKGVVVAFMTQDILNNFRNNPGWKVGVDGSITIIDQGLGKSIDTDNILDPIVAFVFDNRGLMYSLTMEGTIFNLISK